MKNKHMYIKISVLQSTHEDGPLPPYPVPVVTMWIMQKAHSVQVSKGSQMQSVVSE